MSPGREGRAAWSPAGGPPVSPLQRPPAPVRVDGRGQVRYGPASLWTPSEGPYRRETGGAGGEPDGRTIAIRKATWD